MNVRTPVSSHLKIAGLVVLVLGMWGALIPFVGPTFGYGMGGSAAWTWTESHATLHLAPGLAAILGAVMLLASRRQGVQLAGALIAVAGGLWFVISPSLHPLWAGDSSGGVMSGGMMHAESAASSALSALGYHYGAGALIAVAGAYAVGMLAATWRGVGQSSPAWLDADQGRGSSRESALVNQ